MAPAGRPTWRPTQRRTKFAFALWCCAAAALLVGANATGPSRKLKQVLNGVTEFFDTPTVAGSATASAQGTGALGIDGTIHAAAGLSGTTGLAIANPVLQDVLAATGNTYPNRPQVANTAYVNVPLSLASTTRPTVGYGFTESQGDLYSQSLGATGLAEFGYNPLSNQLSFSTSGQGTSAFNPGSSDQIVPTQGTSVDGAPAGGGLSGIEQIGTADEQTTLGLARGVQSGEAIAYPANVLTASYVPRTCTQILAYGVTLSNYDLGAPAGPLPRNNPVNLIPFCLQYFNFAVLDDFRAFLDGFSANKDYYYDEYAYSEDGFFPTTVADSFPLNGTSTDYSTSTDTASTDGSDSAATQSVKSGAATAAAKKKGTKHKGTQAATRAAIDSLSGQASSGKTPQDAVQQLQDKIVAKSNPAVAQFLATPAGAALLQRATTGPSARLSLGTTSIAADTAARALAPLAMPLANITQALSNLTNIAVANATNIALKGAVSTLSVTAPLLGLRANVSRAVLQPIADVGDKLATASDAALQAQQAQKAAATAAQAADPAVAAQLAAVSPGANTVQMLQDVAGR